MKACAGDGTRTGFFHAPDAVFTGAVLLFPPAAGTIKNQGEKAAQNRRPAGPQRGKNRKHV